ncbi:putative multidrug export ATP-binding/permease protein [Ruminiclostridium hungatei]|uniref:Putative multidrug export ATP-binding/permease protein n=1 Tax=Ruminiclostridium hungatei TaxID=48256 RepID=A0A1V4SG19_RUMHU|nr:ABC transporter ATP-binding protein [Ruminiclostridium hungatei]OPX42734.1 putative multidrug export ATP-binding/permease protein [Ruminiclostridium hungatei]
MGKILKHLKPHIFAIIGIVAFLLVQAVCDLSLPDYMSNIVNVGIQQKGIENAVPDLIRKGEMDKLTFFMTAEDKKFVLDNYTLLEKSKISQKDSDKYSKNYPEIKDNDVYKLNDITEETTDLLIKTLSKPELVVYLMEAKDGASEFQMDGKGDNGKLLQGLSQLPEGTDPFEFFAKLPEEQLKAIRSEIDKGFEALPDSIISQGAVVYVKAEYEALGRDTGKMQSDFIILSGLKMLGVALIGMAASVIVGLWAARVSAGLGRSLRRNVFENVVDFSNTEFDKFSTSSLITRCTNDIQQVQMFMVMFLRLVFYAPILGVGGFLKAMHTDTSMSWVIGVSVLAILSLVLVMFAVAIPKFRSIQKLIDKLNLVTRESLTGMLVIRAFGTQKKEEEKFEKANADLTNTNLFVSRIMTAMFPMMMLILNGVVLLIVWVGSHQVDMGNMQVGNMMAFMQYAMQIIFAFLMISMVSITLPRASVSINRIAEVINTKPSILDPKSSKEFDGSLKGTVEFRDVGFKYPGAEDEVLSNINFAAKPGETVAFIGSTGSGKSTLINLIPRFYDVTSGQILLDGADIREVPQKELREKIGYVPQKGILFSGTIESNLKYGLESATQEDLELAADIAQATEFISGKDEGYGTEIAQGGTNVSGGQKQRLSIARALVKKPEIFIFDDSFSALDYKTDAALRKALKTKTRGATVLIVAQRISTVMNADKILVLDEGRVVGMGTHKELLANCEVYQQIALSQLSKEELA